MIVSRLWIFQISLVIYLVICFNNTLHGLNMYFCTIRINWENVKIRIKFLFFVSLFDRNIHTMKVFKVGHNVNNYHILPIIIAGLVHFNSSKCCIFAFKVLFGKTVFRRI